uniref:Uncharacterized protein n=1 Tax=Rhizophora mucronata TaxID=61149 RepID=A0A2P2R5C0_RHIMU
MPFKIAKPLAFLAQMPVNGLG